MSRHNIPRDLSSIEEISSLDELIRLWRDQKLKYLSVSEQALCYEEIITLCKDGYTETVMSPRGDINEITRRDLRGRLRSSELC